MAHTGLQVEQVGFVTQDNGVIGCSPDGLIKSGDDYIGGVEIKCPFPATHVKYHAGGKLPDEYKQQVHGSMAVTGLNRWEFWSYFPGLAPFHITVERDSYTEKVERALETFLIEYAELSRKLKPVLSL